MTYEHGRARTLLLLAAAAALAMVPAGSAAWAYDISGIGGKIGYVDPSDGIDGTVQFGVHVELEQPGSRVHLMPAVMYWSSDGVTDVNPAFDVYYHFSPEGTVTPYLGGGLGLHFYDFEGIDEGETDFGGDLLGGIRFPGRSMHAFVETRFAITDISQVSLLGGLTFHVH